jgi:HAD superfamily hydrolase (TIGR01509 family)
MLRGMIFDLDGVIIDSHPLHRQAWRKFLNGVGHAVEETELEFILDGRKRDEILRHFLGELTPAQIAAYGAQKDKILRELRAEMQPFPGIVDFLEVIWQAGIRIALATSASSKRAHGTLEKLGLADYFEAIVTGDDVAASKPDPTIYRLIAKRLNEPPGNLLAFEDAVSGVRSATAAGIRCVGIASARQSEHAESLRTAGANPVVSDFYSLTLTALDGDFQ